MANSILGWLSRGRRANGGGTGVGRERPSRHPSPVGWAEIDLPTRCGKRFNPHPMKCVFACRWSLCSLPAWPAAQDMPSPAPALLPPPSTPGAVMLCRAALSVCLPASGSLCGQGHRCAAGGGARAGPAHVAYRWSVAMDALFLERSPGGSVRLGNTLSNSNFPVQVDSLYSDDAPFRS